MKSILLILALITVHTFPTQATETEKKESEVIILDIELESIEAEEACPTCLMEVQIFDANFKLIKTGQMSILEDTQDKALEVLIQQSGLLMQTETTFIYQIEE